ncbi:DUF4145 domain-containing protein [Microbacterium resistens]|uniref:DUF4145 domain-containing protein n=1 Tax=Microbacterium resistens TaxID=156977 RepID=A0ABY3RXD9_9MICO|nr:DUF4145 domain-containing protein [Microbacterium resistens]UGS27571.1 DUF4145 domain-containing protein [Microbacterium resistens]
MSADVYGQDLSPEALYDPTVMSLPETFECPKCSARSRHLRVPLAVLVHHEYGRSHDPFVDDVPYGFEGNWLSGPPSTYEQWTASVCLGCGKSSVWRGQKLIYPAPPQKLNPHPDLSTEASSLFKEATAVRPHSPRAAAALARAAMEAQLKALFPSTRAANLQDRLGELRQHVRPGLWKLLTTLRVVGNDALHGSDGSVAIDLTGADADVIDALLGAINLLVDEMVTQARETDALYLKIPESKREAAERAADLFTPREGPTPPAA